MSPTYYTKIELRNGFAQRAVSTSPTCSSLGEWVGRGAEINIEGLNVSRVTRRLIRALCGDLWALLFDQNAELVDGNKSYSHSPEFIFSHGVVSWLMKNKGFRELIVTTRGLPLTSADVAIQIAETIFKDRIMQSVASCASDESDHEQRKNKQNSNARGKSSGGKGNQQQSASNGGDPDDEQDEEPSDDQDSEQDDGDDQQGDPNQKMRDELDKVTSNSMMQGMLSKTIKAAQKEVEKFAPAMKSFGLEQSDEPMVVNYQDLKDLMSHNTEFITTLSTVLGRLFGSGMDTLEKTIDSQIGSIAEVDYTRDMTRVFPADRVNLMSDKVPKYARAKAVSEWASHGLVGWKKKASASRMGSFVGMIDGSGSMTGKDIAIAKALALGIAKIVKEGDIGYVDNDESQRRFALCEFSDYYSTLWIDEKADGKAVIEWACHHFNGGTDITEAIDAMNKRIMTMIGEGVVGIDALIVTDSEAHITDYKVIDEVKRLHAEHGVRLFYIHIGNQKLIPGIKDVAEIVLKINRDDLEDAAGKLVVSIVKSLVRNVDEELSLAIR